MEWHSSRRQKTKAETEAEEEPETKTQPCQLILWPLVRHMCGARWSVSGLLNCCGFLQLCLRSTLM